MHPKTCNVIQEKYPKQKYAMYFMSGEKEKYPRNLLSCFKLAFVFQKSELRNEIQPFYSPHSPVHIMT